MAGDPGTVGETTYDVVSYPSLSHFSAQPDTLAVIARLLGFEAVGMTACRLLELGCGDGANIIPLAEAFPGSTFVGVDLSQRAVSRGREDIEALGLANIRLEAADLTTWRPEPGGFDYVIAHGLYAWVPPEVQEAVMVVTGRALREGGLAMVSYNVAPGCNVRLMVRELIDFELRNVEDPAERRDRGHAILRQALEDISPVNAVAKTLLGEARRWAEGASDSLLHDILSPAYLPARLTEVVAHAGRHGLSYFGDTNPGDLRRELFPDDRDARLLEMSGGDLVEAQHRHDLRTASPFRHTVLRKGPPRGAQVLDRSAILAMHASLSRSLAEGDELGTEEDGQWTIQFTTTEGVPLRIGGAPVRRFLQALADVFPGSLPISALGVFGERLDAVTMLYASGAIRLSTEPLKIAAKPGPMPAASAFARRQAAQGRPVTRLDHGMVSGDATGRSLLKNLDGRSTAPEIAARMAAELGLSPETLLAELPSNLAALAKLALIKAS